MAVLFITKIENNETKNEGFCLKCARELGIPQVDSILSGMGISEDDFEAMENDLQSLMGGDGDSLEPGILIGLLHPVPPQTQQPQNH